MAAVLIETLVEQPEERLVLGGTANLTRAGTDAGALRGMLEALEEQVVVLRLLTSAQDPGTVTVRIGEENESEDLWSAVDGLDRLRRRDHRARRHGRRRADPDGLPEHDRGGACGRPLRR